MRSFVASVALLLAALSTTAALAAYVAHETVLDPANAGKVLSAAVKQGELRDMVLSRALPGYASLPTAYRDDVDRLARSRRVDRALSRVSVDADGSVDLTPVRRQLAGGLRKAGYDQLADRALAADAPDRVQLPRRVWGAYEDARDTTWLVATRGAALAGLLYLAALVVSPHRRRVLMLGGVSLLLSGAAALALVRHLPDLADAAGAGSWVRASSRVAVPDLESVAPMLVPIGVVAAALLVASLLLPRRRTV